MQRGKEKEREGERKMSKERQRQTETRNTQRDIYRHGKRQNDAHET